MFKASDFRVREVVNLSEGEKLGYVYDMEIDEKTGKISAIVVPGKSPHTLSLRKGKTIIPWDKIKKIGDDIIIVDISV